MNPLKNSVQLMGSLGIDPEIRILEDGRKMARLAIVTNETYNNTKGERVTETQWHNLVVWGKAVGIVEKFCSRGSKLAIEGKLINRHYIDKEGIKRYVTEIDVSELLMLSRETNKRKGLYKT